jgi:signal peptidase
MKDAIDQGDLVISKLITEENREEIDLKEEDIVSYYDAYEKKLITHRIIEVRGEGNTRTYTTKGDNAPAPDVPTTINEIQSVYLFRIPFLGGFIDFLKTPLGFILCLVLPLLGFIAWQAYKLVSLYLKSKKLELEEEAEKISKTKSELSEEEKNAIIAEYLAKQAQAEQEQAAKPAEQKTQASKADASRSNTAQKSQGAQPKKQNNASGNKRKGKR